MSRFPKDWQGLKNGQLLLALQRSEFECLITCDKSLVEQQNLAARQVAVVVLPSQKLVTLEAIARTIAESVLQVLPGQFIRISR